MFYRILIGVLVSCLIASCSTSSTKDVKSTNVGKECLKEAKRQEMLRNSGKPSKYILCDHLKGEIDIYGKKI